MVYIFGARTYGNIKCEQRCEDEGIRRGFISLGEKCICEDSPSGKDGNL